MNTDLVMVIIGAVGFLITMTTAWHGRFRTAAGTGLLTGALLVVCMVVFQPAESRAGAAAFPSAVGHPPA